VVLKRAEIIARVLETIKPVVLPEERILGAVYRRRRGHEGVSDPDAWRVRVAFPEQHRYDESWPLPESVRDELKWWKNQQTGRRGANQPRNENGWLGKYAVASPHGNVGGHTLPDHGILLNAGVDELRRQIADRLDRGVTRSQHDQLTAMDRCLSGLATYCMRCAQAGRKKAEEVEDLDLKIRLEEAAANCESLASNPPANFHQALQLIYFSNFLDLADNPGDAYSYGRIDQLLYPFYRADVESGNLTYEEAFELVCHFIIKIWVSQSSVNLTVGGVDENGEDATNDLSTMFLEAMEITEMTVDLSVRLHRNAPESFVQTVARIVRKSFGRPSLYNDDVTIESLIISGIELADARDYAPLGCVEVMIPGRSAYRTMSMGLNLPKVLELVLNGGQCQVTGDPVWEDVPEEFENFDALMCEYRKRVSQILELGMEIIRADEESEPDVRPRPWLTVLSRGGIEDAVDLTAGQPKYDPVGVTLDGVADIVNSLFAVKKMVFDDGRVTLDILREALQANWEGHEGLRQFAINRLPRFGQDDPEINAIARAETDHYAACFDGQKTFYGGPFWPMIFGVSTGLIYGRSPKTGATPSGRRLGETLAMSFQPSSAGPQGCATAMLQSITSINFLKFPGGVSNVQEIDPSLVQGEKGLDRLTDLIQGFFKLGGMELSLNFLDEETLREAQQDPDRHRYLMVRLFGLSAQFVNLSSKVQENVIERVVSASRRPLVGG
jgi:formate C-acetyltransferase